MDASVEVAWHAMPVDDVVKRLATRTGTGLDASEAAARLQKYGPNQLPEGKKRGPFNIASYANRSLLSRLATLFVLNRLMV